MTWLAGRPAAAAAGFAAAAPAGSAAYSTIFSAQVAGVSGGASEVQGSDGSPLRAPSCCGRDRDGDIGEPVSGQRDRRPGGSARTQLARAAAEASRDPALLAEVTADQVDWHQVASLVRRGCPPQLALRIVS
jgi:hypothetical protein